MTQALIGHTGFVGSNLLRQRHFDATYNSISIGDIRGCAFGRVLCAGVTAVKWWANKNPEEDWVKIKNLIDHLSHITADRFTLISTVDIYGSPCGLAEDTRPDEANLHAYGLNRLRLEDFIRSHFPRHHIVRLPALFGSGLKKNAIYDLMNDNMTDVINPASSFQWYPVHRLSDDLECVENNDIPLINFVTQPVTMGTIQQLYFPNVAMGAKAGSAVHYDLHTRLGRLFGSDNEYILSKENVLSDLGDYLAQERAA